jgi:hypothetical protein
MITRRIFYPYFLKTHLAVSAIFPFASRLKNQSTAVHLTINSASDRVKLSIFDTPWRLHQG